MATSLRGAAGTAIEAADGTIVERRHVPDPDVEELELSLLLEAVAQRFGFEFRSHDRAAVKRKLHGLMARRGLRTVSQLQDRVLHDAAASSALLRALGVAPASMFDDPDEARQLLAVAEGCLPGAPLPKVWLADCAGAEQAWTAAVLLAERQLLWRTEIYATVPSDELLEEALGASIPLEKMGEYQRCYERAGGSGRLSEYFQLDGGRLVPVPQLKSRIVWAQYNLVTDASFNEFQLIVCRRALPDFGPLLRRRVLHLFHDSLAVLGVLGIDRELDEEARQAGQYSRLIAGQPWYKRIA
ncbi:CheR family methyltransferase [Pseudoduganella umbonata]|uniref:Chemotaxis protein n=1 Tax=Pseudoduganella umbonata TaxID=864828 RepID=A0A4P8HQ92_9BURK|nr:CheR family methyltransferase [Pseudoduganella umbonata]MBB3221483.1 chemotaxis protein methyltransferase CheR [Pseudoduganella umbonata]QCP10634.1 chemotaxis protein [Pseudoduganella umbonata]